MSILRFIPELPLLRRELIELSNRRRTYVVRFVGAIVILTIVLIAFYRQMNIHSAGRQFNMSTGGWAPVRFDGIGGTIFQTIVPLLFYSVQLLMPGLICGAITLEKERNTLGTLFVTRLSPMTIILEKLGSRLVPMFSFLLLTFPVLAFLYSLGGVDTTLLLSTLWLLICECILFASLGLLCSSWFATTSSAFICSYVLAGLLAISSTVMQLAARIPVLTPYDVWLFVFGRDVFGIRQNPGAIEQELAALLTEPASGNGSGLLVRLSVIVAASVPSMMFAGGLLLLARFFLFRRAFVSSSSVLLRVFKRVDTFFVNLNQQTTGGVVLIRDCNSLPLFDPVAWRERAKKSLGKARYLFRVLVVLEGPVLFICLSAATVSQASSFSGLRFLLSLVWGIATMILGMKASTIISSERTRETLEALLSTPLTSREILEQKVAGMGRLMLVLSIPILSVHLTLLLMHFDLLMVFSNPLQGAILDVLLYSGLSVATTFILMHLITWLSVLMGMRGKSQPRSAMAALTLIGAWIAISQILFSPGSLLYNHFGAAIAGLDRPLLQWRDQASIEEKARYHSRLSNFATLALATRPDGSIQANESILDVSGGGRSNERELYFGFTPNRGSAAATALLLVGWQLLLTFLIRKWTLYRAPHLLGRLDNAMISPIKVQNGATMIAVATESAG